MIVLCLRISGAGMTTLVQQFYALLNIEKSKFTQIISHLFEHIII